MTTNISGVRRTTFLSRKPVLRREFLRLVVVMELLRALKDIGYDIIGIDPSKCGIEHGRRNNPAFTIIRRLGV